MVLTLKIKDKEEKLRGMKWKPTATSSEFLKKIVGNVGVNYKSSFENIRKTSGNRRESSESGQKGSNNLGGNK